MRRLPLVLSFGLALDCLAVGLFLVAMQVSQNLRSKCNKQYDRCESLAAWVKGVGKIARVWVGAE
jgi:hypothetical protein